MGVTGWGCGPRVLLSPDDERVREAAIAAVTAHLRLGDADRFAAWHDAPDRTQDDVLDAFQRTARILEGYHPSRVFTPTIQDMTGIHLGVALIRYGEDNSYLAVGHIEPSLMVAASTACHIDLTGEPLAGGTWRPDALERSVRNEYALHWRDERGQHWFDFDPVDWRTPGSVPVTTLTVD
ncbi:mucin [Streptomyces himastatinicus ATCC 53653]|uniref:Mucin n=2 Tax=Streptomyces violaceusniger group TaxID=2839105 RepID=D9WX26_9ACTN|nr:hypothetical protein [Streptomyces himastatinicus]EFL29454.1 mucin [Streptomyces himastatinicus ATCC 53653]